jgi:hypothetical protein
MRFFQNTPCFQVSGGAAAKQAVKEPSMATVRRLSNDLSAALSLRVAFLVMLLVIVLPFLAYEVQDYSQNAWIDVIKVTAKNETVSAWQLSNLARKVENFYRPKDAKLLHLHIESPFQSTLDRSYTSARSVLRENNVFIYSSSYSLSNSSLATSVRRGYLAAQSSLLPPPARSGATVSFTVSLKLDMTVENEQNALFNILTILLVVVVLISFSYSFTNSVQNIVVKPLGKMV